MNPQNHIFATVRLESGCNVKDGEYSIEITGMHGRVVMNGYEQNDFELVVECIEENIEMFNLQEETYVELILVDEWESDGFPHMTHRYEIKSWRKFRYG